MMSKQVNSQFLGWLLVDGHTQSSPLTPWWKTTRSLSLQIALQGSIHSQRWSLWHIQGYYFPAHANPLISSNWSENQTKVVFRCSHSFGMVSGLTFLGVIPLGSHHVDREG